MIPPGLYTAGDGHAGKTASIEGSPLDAGDTMLNGHVLELAATREGRCPDGLYAGRNGHASKTCAIIERRIADFGNTLAFIPRRYNYIGVCTIIICNSISVIS